MSRFAIPRSRLLRALAVPAILGLVAILYWPVSTAGFVWDDKLCFRDEAWLRADDWKRFLLSGFCDWSNYFRPLAVALHAVQIKAFAVSPGPMHLVSLGLHLINTALVGLLARRLSAKIRGSQSSVSLSVTAAAIYGLHPALVEPVVWIGCQDDLLLTLFSLLAILLNWSIARAGPRAIAVGVCFFLAACSKESAVVTPLLLFLTDLATTQAVFGHQSWTDSLRALIRRQWSVYGAVLLAGLGYLILRRSSLGHLLLPVGHESFFTFAHLHGAASTYLAYLRLIIWPMVGLNPLHLPPSGGFGEVSAGSIAVIAIAAGIPVTALYLAWRRYFPGFILLAATAALLPVIRLLPVAFNESTYHERYVMLAVAVVCALLPSAAPTTASGHARTLRLAALPVLGVWLILAVINIRVTLPLWSDDLKLWQWALRENPESSLAKDHLLTAYIDRNDRAHARALADSFLAGNVRCPNCMINAAFVYLADNDAVHAAAALERLEHERVLTYDVRSLRAFIFAKGGLLELQGDADGAEGAYRAAIRMDPLDPATQTALALLLARQRRTAEARSVLETALSLSPPDEREQRREQFERTVAASDHAPQQ